MEAAMKRATEAYGAIPLPPPGEESEVRDDAGVDAVVMYGKGACVHPPAAAKALASALEKCEEFRRLEIGPVIMVKSTHHKWGGLLPPASLPVTIRWYFLVRDPSLSVEQEFFPFFNRYTCRNWDRFQLLGDPMFDYNNVLVVADGCYTQPAALNFWYPKDDPYEPYYVEICAKMATASGITFPQKFEALLPPTSAFRTRNNGGGVGGAGAEM
jgi:hypothetical protein